MALCNSCVLPPEHSSNRIADDIASSKYNDVGSYIQYEGDFQP
jgi:hypothetical protein